VAPGLHRGGDEQRLARRGGQVGELAGEGLLDPLAGRHRPDHRLAARQLIGAQRARDLGERERVAVRGGDQVRGDVVVDAVLGLAPQQLGRRRVVERCDRERLDAGERADDLADRAGRADQHDALGAQPARDEDQRVARRVVEPVHVVGEHDERPLLGGRGEQREHPGRDREAVERGRRLERQRAAQRARLDLGDLVAQRQQRREQLEQAGERDV
jgi:hypothetical protein